MLLEEIVHNFVGDYLWQENHQVVCNFVNSAANGQFCDLKSHRLRNNIDSFLSCESFTNVRFCLAERRSVFGQGVFRDIGLDVRWVKLSDFDAVRSAFGSEDFSETRETELGCSIHRPHWRAHISCNRKNVYDLTAFTRNHARKDSFADGDVRQAVDIHHLSAYAKI